MCLVQEGPNPAYIYWQVTQTESEIESYTQITRAHTHTNTTLLQHQAI